MEVTVKVADCPGTTNVSETGWLVIMGGFTADGRREGEREERGREGGKEGEGEIKVNGVEYGMLLSLVNHLRYTNILTHCQAGSSGGD